MNSNDTSIVSKIVLAVVLIAIALTVWGVLVFSKGDEPTTTNATPSPTLKPVPTARPTGQTAVPTTVQTTPDPNATATVTVSPTPSVTTTPTPTTEASGEEISFVVNATEYSFSPPLIRVPAGSRVAIKFNNNGTMQHDFMIDEWNVQSQVLSAGDSETLEFVVPADASGEYNYYCSIGTHRAQGMEGTIQIVE